MSLPQSRAERPPAILVVDDEDPLRQVVCRELAADGYRTLEARSAQQALELLGEPPEPIELVITDIRMPGMDGWELGRRLSRLCPGLPVLYMSAFPPGDIFHRSPVVDSFPFLQKPFAGQTLLAKVREVLPSGEIGRPSQPCGPADRP
jgi:DNA-binding NtrC family response regulator